MHTESVLSSAPRHEFDSDKVHHGQSGGILLVLADRALFPGPPLHLGGFPNSPKSQVLIHCSNSIHRQTLRGHQPIDKAGPFSYCLAPVKHVFTKHLHKNELFPNVNKEACQKIGCSAPQYGELL